MSVTYELGQRVRITGTAVKIKQARRIEYIEGGLPYRDNYPTRKEFSAGVVVGQRAVSPGYVESGVPASRPTRGAHAASGSSHSTST